MCIFYLLYKIVKENMQSYIKKTKGKNIFVNLLSC